MNWIGFIGYLFIGVAWAEFIKSEYWRNKRVIEYHVYVYHALFWPVSVIVYCIGRWRH